MRIMLLSFKPEIYEKIYTGIKIFEHRRNFPDEPVKAYMYVSKPVRAIKGIVYLNNRHIITDWEKDFSFDPDAINRIKEYEKSYRYAMEISEFKETTEIRLDDIKSDFPKFVVPQSYIYLDNKPELLQYIESKIEIKGKNIKHDFSYVTSEQICVH
ncbi:MAG: hypothetical protein ACI4J6_11505 [Oscillospiraceae bacterium]